MQGGQISAGQRFASVSAVGESAEWGGGGQEQHEAPLLHPPHHQPQEQDHTQHW